MTHLVTHPRPIRNNSENSTDGPHVFQGRTDRENMLRLTAFIIAAASLAACANIATERVQTLATDYHASIDTQIAAAR